MNVLGVIAKIATEVCVPFAGKSTLCDVARHLYEEEHVGTLSSNIEEKFGLSALADKLLVLCNEVRHDFCLNQAEFQSMVSGESVQVATKGRTACGMIWIIPLLMAGNEVPAWTDAAGSVQRRLLIFQFSKMVLESDSTLKERLKREMGTLIKKINVAYLEAAGHHGSEDLWNHLPTYFKDRRAEVAMDTNALRKFLHVKTGAVEVGPEKYCLADTFNSRYNAFCRAHTYNIKSNRLTSDYQAGPFAQYGITSVYEERIDPEGGQDAVPETKLWYIGVALRN